MPEFDAVVIGAGVIGCATALSLVQRDRRRVLVLELNLREPHTIVGELLQPDGVAKLAELGAEECLEGGHMDTSPVQSYLLHQHGCASPLLLPYPANAEGRGFHHGRLVGRLRRRLHDSPNITLKSGSVSALRMEGNVVTGVEWLDCHREAHRTSAHLTVVCDGMYSRFRRQLCSRVDDCCFGRFIGVKITDCHLPQPHTANVVLNAACKSPQVPPAIVFYPIGEEEKAIRVLVDVPMAMHLPSNQVTAWMLSTVKPLLPTAELQEGFERAVCNGDVMSKLNKAVTSEPNLSIAGAVLVGDALNSRHPLTGGGMTAGLTGSVLLRDVLEGLDLRDIQATHAAVATFYRKVSEENATVNILANALYGVVSDAALTQALFQYLSRGGECASAPLELLSGVSRSCSLLATHFSRVALCHLPSLLKCESLWRAMFDITSVLRSACGVLQGTIQREKGVPFKLQMCCSVAWLLLFTPSSHFISSNRP